MRRNILECPECFFILEIGAVKCDAPKIIEQIPLKGAHTSCLLFYTFSEGVQ